MLKRILVATDGSRLSDNAVNHAVELARALGAKLVAFHASPAFSGTPSQAEGLAKIRDTMRRSEYEAVAAREARKVLEPVEREAAAAQIECTVAHAFAEAPWQAILAAARKCDAAIVMASHGRRGLSAFLLGSETQNVLTHSDLPVIVVR